VLLIGLIAWGKHQVMIIKYEFLNHLWQSLVLVIFSILFTQSTIFKYHLVYTKDLLRTLEKFKLPVSKITGEIES
jgi:hypothetical protein